MTQTVKLNAEMRDRAGKGTARATRRAGQTPVVVYGDKKEAIMLSIETRELQIIMNRPGFFTNIYELTANGETHRAVARDLQLHPVSDAPLHVDFLRVSKNTVVTVDVPVVFVGEENCAGLKKGGILNIARHSVEINVPATNIPEALSVDVSGLELNEAVKISAVELPEGAEPTITDRDFTIASIAAPAGLKSEADGAEETEEAAAEE